MELIKEYEGREVVLKIDEEPREYGQFAVELIVDGKIRHKCWYTAKEAK